MLVSKVEGLKVEGRRLRTLRLQTGDFRPLTPSTFDLDQRL
jgi:hypothetical protein